ncbi:MAG TPA: glycosyltransferase family 39 protein [Thermoanaerobaculia bacterium]|nr:glycosyltransferase family 39 protein [Thermoanaerobaculia bacterium]
MTSRLVLVIGACVLFAAIAAGFAYTLDVSSDEGFYAEAAFRAASGLVAYRDFGYSQGPVVPYVNGAAMRLLGFGLLRQRLLGAAQGVLQMAVLMLLAVRLGDALAGRAAAAVLVLSLHWVENVTLGNTYALGGLFVALAALAFASLENPRARLAATLACGALAAGCRLSLAPFGALLALALVLEMRRVSFAVLAAALGAAFGFAVYGPFLLADPEATLFWTVRFHLASVVERRGAPSLAEAFALAPAAAVLAAAALALWRRSRSADRGAAAARALFAAALATAAANLLVRAPYGGYLTPVVGVVAVSGARLLFGALPARRGVAAATLVLAAAAGAALFRPALRPAGLDDVAGAAAFVRARTAPSARIACTLPEVALEAGRDVLPGLEMGKFGFTEEMTPARAARLHLAHASVLEEALRDRTVGAVVLSQSRNWNFGWSAPSLRPTSRETLARLRAALDAGWKVGDANETVLVLVPR